MSLGNPTEFDGWVESYDATVNDGVGFPFAGYECVLTRLVALTEAEPSHSVLDLGIGTGNLALPFVDWPDEFRDHVAPGGRITVADLAFSTATELDHAREEWAASWGEEHYWVVDRDVAAGNDDGLAVRYERVVAFAGVFTVARRVESQGTGTVAQIHGTDGEVGA
jgi:hypothetical protein